MARGWGDVGAVASLLAEFRDWWDKSEPTEEGIRDTVRRVVEDPQTEFLLAAPAGADVAAGVCQIRYRLSVWTGADDCWLEDLYVRQHARGAGLGRALVRAVLERAGARVAREIGVPQSD